MRGERVLDAPETVFGREFDLPLRVGGTAQCAEQGIVGRRKAEMRREIELIAHRRPPRAACWECRIGGGFWPVGLSIEIGRAHVCTPVTKAHLVCRSLLEKNNTTYYNNEE